MAVRTFRRALVLGSIGLDLLAASALANDSGSAPRATASPIAPAPVAPNPLDGLARDLNLNLMAPSEDPTVRVPLRPGEWSLFGRLQPYAALSARTLRPDLLDASGVTAPSRESRIDDLSNGVGIGGGLNWQLSSRLGLFGEYLFVPRHGGAASAGTARRDADPPELKGGVSVRF